MPIDYSRYPKHWRVISRRIRFERAGNRCEWCGVLNYERHPVTGSRVILTVAHKDHVIEHCDGLEVDPDLPLLPEPESNLAALCQRCHLGHDLPRHIYNRKYGQDTRRLNYDLFNE